MALWRKPYTLRRYQQRKPRRGYSTSPYTDILVELDVQPLESRELEALPEGERSKRRVKTFGDYAIQTSDPSTGCKADRLFYEGRWYECEAAPPWSATPMAHYAGQFVQVPETEERAAPVVVPQGGGGA